MPFISFCCDKLQITKFYYLNHFKGTVKKHPSQSNYYTVITTFYPQNSTDLLKLININFLFSIPLQPLAIIISFISRILTTKSSSYKWNHTVFFFSVTDLSQQNIFNFHPSCTICIAELPPFLKLSKKYIAERNQRQSKWKHILCSLIGRQYC